MKKLIILMLILIMPLMSCQSIKKVPETNLCFPIFPTLDKYEKLENGMIAVPESYIFELARFKVLYEELENNYDLIYNCN